MKGNLWLCSLWGHVEMERQKNKEIVLNPFSTEFNIHNGIFSTSAITRPRRWLSKFAFALCASMEKTRFMDAVDSAFGLRIGFSVQRPLQRPTFHCNFLIEALKSPYSFQLNKSKSFAFVEDSKLLQLYRPRFASITPSFVCKAFRHEPVQVKYLFSFRSLPFSLFSVIRVSMAIIGSSPISKWG